MKKLILLLLPVLMIAISCESTSEPEEQTKSPREYGWTCDTLSYENSSQVIMEDIWAGAKSNIYVCGHNSAFMATLWKYNGEQWNRVDLFRDIEMGPHILNEIHGFQDVYNYGVWIAGERITETSDGPLRGRQTMILYNDGTKWEEKDIKLEGRMLSVHGDRYNNVWFGGDHGRVYHWNGTSFESDVIVIEGYEDMDSEVNKIRVFNGETYLQVRVQDSENHEVIHFFMRGDIQNWTILSTMNTNDSKWGWADLYVSEWSKMYSNERGIWEWNDTGWTEIISTSRSFIDQMMGVSEDNMLLAGSFGKVYYWDGFDLMQIEELNYPEVHYSGLWMFSDEAYVFGFSQTEKGDRTVIFHGK